MKKLLKPFGHWFEFPIRHSARQAPSEILENKIGAKPDAIRLSTYRGGIEFDDASRRVMGRGNSSTRYINSHGQEDYYTRWVGRHGGHEFNDAVSPPHINFLPGEINSVNGKNINYHLFYKKGGAPQTSIYNSRGKIKQKELFGMDEILKIITNSEQENILVIEHKNIVN